VVARIVGALLAVGLAAGAFLAGRESVGGSKPSATPGSYRAGYLAGREDAFGNFDGGWGYGDLYVVVLRRGGPGITYRVAERWPMHRGVEYRVCGRTLCTRPAS
jgi:hypothetical protein